MNYIPEVRNVTEDVTDNVTEDVTESDEDKIINLIKKNPYSTRKDMAILIGKTVRTVQRILNNSKRIKRIGSDFKGYWNVID